jgi:anaerobic magnesium-protoporphyrin IX monomethyl ester cyclase
LPEGSLEKDLETLEMNVQCQPDYAWVSIFQPYPGTSLGELCKVKGYYTGDFRDLGDNFFDSSKLNFSEQYKNQLSNLQKLFAVAVEHPELYNSGLLKTLIDLPYESTREPFTKFYKDFRKTGDRKLYGFDL